MTSFLRNTPNKNSFFLCVAHARVQSPVLYPFFVFSNVHIFKRKKWRKILSKNPNHVLKLGDDSWAFGIIFENLFWISFVWGPSHPFLNSPPTPLTGPKYAMFLAAIVLQPNQIKWNTKKRGEFFRNAFIWHSSNSGRHGMVDVIKSKLFCICCHFNKESAVSSSTTLLQHFFLSFLFRLSSLHPMAHSVRKQSQSNDIPFGRLTEI